jgi:hypothetical protein
VSNGEKTVGPVSTNLLLRGVAADLVPNDCMVRERSWHDWRTLDSVREVAALRRDQSRYGQIHVPRARFHYHGPRTDVGLALLKKRLHWAKNPTEALSIGLCNAMKETGALVGAVHKRHPRTKGLATFVVMGPGMHRQVGRVVRANDPVLALAEAGQSLFGIPKDPPSMIIQERLGDFPACSGVAMMPIRCAGKLFATIELGRPDHAFRRGDVRRLALIAGVVAERFEIVMNVS